MHLAGPERDRSGTRKMSRRWVLIEAPQLPSIWRAARQEKCKVLRIKELQFVYPGRRTSRAAFRGTRVAFRGDRFPHTLLLGCAEAGGPGRASTARVPRGTFGHRPGPGRGLARRPLLRWTERGRRGAARLNRPVYRAGGLNRPRNADPGLRRPTPSSERPGRFPAGWERSAAAIVDGVSRRTLHRASSAPPWPARVLRAIPPPCVTRRIAARASGATATGGGGADVRLAGPL
jgi:hypothetical protein